MPAPAAKGATATKKSELAAKKRKAPPPKSPMLPAPKIISGTASGVDMANPMQPITKPFEIAVTCP